MGGGSPRPSLAVRRSSPFRHSTGTGAPLLAQGKSSQHKSAQGAVCLLGVSLFGHAKGEGYLSRDALSSSPLGMFIQRQKNKKEIECGQPRTLLASALGPHPPALINLPKVTPTGKGALGSAEIVGVVVSAPLMHKFSTSQTQQPEH